VKKELKEDHFFYIRGRHSLREETTPRELTKPPIARGRACGARAIFKILALQLLVVKGERGMVSRRKKKKGGVGGIRENELFRVRRKKATLRAQEKSPRADRDRRLAKLG